MNRKKVLYIIGVMLFMLAACSSSKLSVSGSAEKDFTEKFLQKMVEGEKSGMTNMVSPKFIKENKIDWDDYDVNTYYPKKYEFQKWDSKNGIIEFIISGESWAHRINFKIVKEKGKLYFWPGKAAEGWVHPWNHVDSYINRDN